MYRACSFATLAHEQRLVRPILVEGKCHKIVGGRHPTVKLGLEEQGRRFVSNDCFLGDPDRIWLVTGPNMAGKSTFLRQNALITILAQVGSLVPADYAEMGIVDKIFSRIGAQDQLHAWLHPGILSPTSSLGATSDLQSANRCAHFYALVAALLIARRAQMQISLAMTLDDNPLHLIRADPDPVHTERAMIDRISCSTAFPRPGDVVEARYADCQPPLGRDPKRELNVLLEMIKVYVPRYLLIRRWLIVADDDLVVANSVGPQDDEGRKTAKLARLGAVRPLSRRHSTAERCPG